MSERTLAHNPIFGIFPAINGRAQFIRLHVKKGTRKQRIESRNCQDSGEGNATGKTIQKSRYFYFFLMGLVEFFVAIL